MNPLMNVMRDVTGRFADSASRFRSSRVERRAKMAQQSWREFFRDLGVQFLVMGIIVAVAAALLWFLTR